MQYFTPRVARRTLLGPLAFFTLFVAAVETSHAESPIEFARDVQPIFNQHCVACHGGVKQAADLSFVYEEQALLTVEPGAPDDSYLIERVTSDDEDFRMPPAEHGPPLSADEIAVLRAWIEQGAEWGPHWAYLAPQRSEPPELDHADWPRTRLDRFVLGRLESEGLNPSPETSPARWQRRASLDLIGLPPTLEQRSAFLAAVAAEGEAAYRAEVERLLGSNRFGEHWASMWLDQVRYADSKGLGQDGRRTIWKYRDWVIDAFNDDLPYDQFTIKQIAGDLLPEPTIDDLVATACHRLTQTNEEGGTDDEQFRIEAVIDRVNTTWQVWQGLTFGCTQCHNHPYEPIEHDEYYRFAAFFNNTVDCDLSSDAPTLAVPLDAEQADEAARLDRRIAKAKHEQWEQGAARLQDDALWRPLREMQAASSNDTQVIVESRDGFDEYHTVGTVSQNTAFTFEAPAPAGLKQITAIRFTGLPIDLVQAAADSEWGFVVSHVAAELVGAGEEEPRSLELVGVLSDDPDPLFDPQASLNEKSSRGFGPYSRINTPRRGAFVLAEPVAVPPGASIRVTLKFNVFELGAFPLVARRGRVDVSGDAALVDLWSAPGRVAAREEIAELEKARRAIRSVSIPVVRDRPSFLARPTHVFLRGNFLDKGEEVVAGTPFFLPPAPEQENLDRLDLARWLVSDENPLTARVQVNRIWGRLFGLGFVETQEDFGSSGEPPAHPALLDDLSARFAGEMGWSTKELLREIVLSATYRQSSQATPELLEKDPRNRLYARGPRRRLPAETVRDQALAIAGLLSDKQYGPPVYPPLPQGVWTPFSGGDRWRTPEVGDPDRYRRTIYTYVKRTIPYPVMAAFDAPSREFCSTRRVPSNTPLQALMALNDATFLEAAEALAERMAATDESVDEQLAHGFLLATCRRPTDRELAELRGLYEATREVVADDPPSGRAALVNLATVLLNLDEVLCN